MQTARCSWHELRWISSRRTQHGLKATSRWYNTPVDETRDADPLCISYETKFNSRSTRSNTSQILSPNQTKIPSRQDLSHEILTTGFLICLKPAYLPDESQSIYLLPDQILHPRIAPKKKGPGIWAICRRDTLENFFNNSMDHYIAFC
jgi:hypothetical protein